MFGEENFDIIFDDELPGELEVLVAGNPSFPDSSSIMSDISKTVIGSLNSKADVTLVHSVKEAMGEIDASNFGLVIADTTLDTCKHDGFEVVDFAYKKGIPGIVFTGYADMTHGSMEDRYSYSTILLKPTGLKCLSSAIKYSLPGKPMLVWWNGSSPESFEKTKAMIKGNGPGYSHLLIRSEENLGFIDSASTDKGFFPYCNAEAIILYADEQHIPQIGNHKSHIGWAMKAGIPIIAVGSNLGLARLTKGLIKQIPADDTLDVTGRIQYVPLVNGQNLVAAVSNYLKENKK